MLEETKIPQLSEKQTSDDDPIDPLVNELFELAEDTGIPPQAIAMQATELGYASVGEALRELKPAREAGRHGNGPIPSVDLMAERITLGPGVGLPPDHLIVNVDYGSAPDYREIGFGSERPVDPKDYRLGLEWELHELCRCMELISGDRLLRLVEPTADPEAPFREFLMPYVQPMPLAPYGWRLGTHCELIALMRSRVEFNMTVHALGSIARSGDRTYFLSLAVSGRRRELNVVWLEANGVPPEGKILLVASRPTEFGKTFF